MVEYLALKIIKNKTKYSKQAEKEVAILMDLKKTDTDNKLNIVHMEENFMFRNHFCISFELLGINLYQYIQRINTIDCTFLEFLIPLYDDYSLFHT